ncbi:hypothetical protein DICA3_D21946 [Diutina catenulata]
MPGSPSIMNFVANPVSYQTQQRLKSQMRQKKREIIEESTNRVYVAKEEKPHHSELNYAHNDDMAKVLKFNRKLARQRVSDDNSSSWSPSSGQSVIDGDPASYYRKYPDLEEEDEEEQDQPTNEPQPTLDSRSVFSDISSVFSIRRSSTSTAPSLPLVKKRTRFFSRKK